MTFMGVVVFVVAEPTLFAASCIVFAASMTIWEFYKAIAPAQDEIEETETTEQT